MVVVWEPPFVGLYGYVLTASRCSKWQLWGDLMSDFVAVVNGSLISSREVQLCSLADCAIDVNEVKAVL